ncbi:MAG: FkbM family methyltransferase [Gaiellaceae bacterium]
MIAAPEAARTALRPLRRRLRPTEVERRLAALRLRRGDVAIDCGANVGEVAVVLADAGAEVHAFEPNPHAFSVLEARLGHRANVHLYPVAVLDRDQPARLYLHRGSNHDAVAASVGSSLLETKGNVDPDCFVDVRAIDLARFVLALGRRIRLVKIDVEGVEHAILHRLLDSGAIELIETVLVEVHDAHVPSLRDETARLRARLRTEGLDSRVLTDWR